MAKSSFNKSFVILLLFDFMASLVNSNEFQRNKSDPSIVIGVIIRVNANHSEEVRMLDFTEKYVNQVYSSILPGYKLKLAIEVVPNRGSTSVSETLDLLSAFCRLMRRGIVASLELVDNDAHEDKASAFLAHISNSLSLPYVMWRTGMSLNTLYPFAVNLHPSRATINGAIIDLVISHLQWKDFTFIYCESGNLAHAQQILRTSTNQLRGIRVRRYTLQTVYKILEEAQENGWTQFVLDMNRTATLDFLQSALNKGMVSKTYHYVLTCLHVVDRLRYGNNVLENYRYNNVNLHAFSLHLRSNSYASHFLKSWKQEMNDDNSNPSLRSALLHDAIMSLARAIRSLGRVIKPKHIPRKVCSNPASYFLLPDLQSPHGFSLWNYLNAVQLNDSLSGPIEFHDGQRYNFVLDINQMTPSGMLIIGSWSSNARLQITEPQKKIPTFFKQKTVGEIPRNNTIKVVTVIQRPFVMEKPDSRGRIGRDRYEGFCINMMEKIANRSKFDWDIRVLENGTYGVLEEDPVTGKVQWTGLMKELVEGRAQLALGAFSISYIRERAIDFTKPFMSLGISILFKKPEGEKPGLFSFLNPLAPEIWLYVVAAYLVVTLCIYAMARFTPYEWHNPHPCENCDDEPYLQTSFTLANSFWFTVGTLTQQGSDINPRALSTRLVGGVWWFFTLIIISSYTANLAAFLTVERHVSAIENVEDLARQEVIRYGALDGGSTMAFFKNSTLDTYNKMWAYMKKNRKEVMVKSTAEGVQRVKKGKYAFLMESVMIEYHMSQDPDCELTRVGGLIDSKGYGIGVAPGWEGLRDEITLHILEMQRDQVLHRLKSKWWKDGSVCQTNSHRSGQDVNEPRSLDLYGVGGIFMTLGCGLILAVIVACVEFSWNSRHRRRKVNYGRKGHSTLCNAMGRELRFACDCYGSSRRRLSQTDPHRSAYDDSAIPPTIRSGGLMRGVEFHRYGNRFTDRSPIIEYKTICTETVT